MLAPRVRPSGHRRVVVRPRAAPRRPTPDRRRAAEHVAGIPAVPGIERVVPADHHHLGGVAVALEQLGAEPEEVQRRHAVVLHDDAGVHLGHEPIDRRADAELAAEVAVLEPGANLAGPVDAVEDPAGACAAVQVVRVAGARPVGGDEQPPRRRAPHSLEHPPGLLRTVERHQQHWDVGGGAHHAPRVVPGRGRAGARAPTVATLNAARTGSHFVQTPRRRTSGRSSSRRTSLASARRRRRSLR